MPGKAGQALLPRTRVIDGSGQPIPKLYVAGNNAGSPFGKLYPGAGGTIGPAMTFAFVAVNDIMARAGNSAHN